MASEISNLLDRVYRNFVMRDLVFVAGGSIVLVSVAYACGDKPSHGLEYVTSGWMKFVLAVSTAYFAGLLAQEGGLALCFIWKKMRCKQVRYLPERWVLLKLKTSHNPDVLLEVERIVFFKQVGATIGSSSILSLIVLIAGAHWNILPFPLPALVLLVLASAICVWEYYYKAQQQAEALRQLSDLPPSDVG